MPGLFVSSAENVKQAINLIEACFTGKSIQSASRPPLEPWMQDDVTVIREDMARLQNSPLAAAIAAQAGIVWESAVNRSRATVWLLRRSGRL